MAIPLRQSTASQEIPLGPFVDSTDGDTAETGLTINNTDIKLWKHGATTLANKNSGGATHISDGVYYATLDATDTNTLGGLVVHCHPSGALAIKVRCVVLTTHVYDSLVAGTDALQVDTIQANGNTIAATNGVLHVLDSSGNAVAAAAALTTVDTVVDGIKTKTDGLNFTGDDVKATLDGEEVVTDAASRTASKADVSALATATNLATVDTVVDAIKVVADALDTLTKADGDGDLAKLLKLALADRVIDKTTDADAWRVLIREAGTENTLETKLLKDVDGSAVASTDTIVGQEVQA